jgi:hypothetical protein
VEAGLWSTLQVARQSGGSTRENFETKICFLSHWSIKGTLRLWWNKQAELDLMAAKCSNKILCKYFVVIIIYTLLHKEKQVYKMFGSY